MSSLDKIENAIGNIDDRFLVEALRTNHNDVSKTDFTCKLHRNACILCATAACICIMVGTTVWKRADLLTKQENFILSEDSLPSSSETILADISENTSSEDNTYTVENSENAEKAADENPSSSNEPIQEDTGKPEIKSDEDEEEQWQIAEDSEQIGKVILSHDELTRVQKVIEDYYISSDLKIIRCVQLNISFPFLQEYEGYMSDEMVLFEVTLENSDIKRYITIGSKDDWNTCNILNESY